MYWSCCLPELVTVLFFFLMVSALCLFRVAAHAWAIFILISSFSWIDNVFSWFRFLKVQKVYTMTSFLPIPVTSSPHFFLPRGKHCHQLLVHILLESFTRVQANSHKRFSSLFLRKWGIVYTMFFTWTFSLPIYFRVFRICTQKSSIFLKKSA